MTYSKSEILRSSRNRPTSGLLFIRQLEPLLQANMASSATQRSHPRYELLYHPGMPGRGEFIRLAFEAAGAPYVDVANESDQGYSTVQQVCMNQGLESVDGNPPIFSPPALKVAGAGKDGSALLISQTPNILFYLGERLSLVPGDEAGRYHVNQVALTALDLNNEIHDTHHPIAVRYSLALS